MSQQDHTSSINLELFQNPASIDSQQTGNPHRIEQDVQRELLSHPELQFSSLVVHRIPNGICLEGILETGQDCPDISRLAQTISGVDEVLNHLVVRTLPSKG